jgi:hypothetical protein
VGGPSFVGLGRLSARSLHLLPMEKIIQVHKMPLRIIGPKIGISGSTVRPVTTSGESGALDRHPLHIWARFGYWARRWGASLLVPQCF